MSFGLSPVFLDHLQTLFSILDVNRVGTISVRDIETNWSDGIANLPQDFLPCLRQVAAPDGNLSFGQFVRGIRIAMQVRDGVGSGTQLEKVGRRWGRAEREREKARMKNGGSMTRSWSEGTSVARHLNGGGKEITWQHDVPAGVVITEEDISNGSSGSPQQRTPPSYESYVTKSAFGQQHNATPRAPSTPPTIQEHMEPPQMRRPPVTSQQRHNLTVRPVSTPPQLNNASGTNPHIPHRLHSGQQTSNADSENGNGIVTLDFSTPDPHPVSPPTLPPRSIFKTKPKPPPRTVSSTQQSRPGSSSGQRPTSYHPESSHTSNYINTAVLPTENTGSLLRSTYANQRRKTVTPVVAFDSPAHSNLKPTLNSSGGTNGSASDAFRPRSHSLSVAFMDNQRQTVQDNLHTVRALHFERRCLKECVCCLEKARARLQCRLDSLNERLTTPSLTTGPVDMQALTGTSKTAKDLTTRSSSQLALMQERADQACQLLLALSAEEETSTKAVSRSTSRLAPPSNSPSTSDVNFKLQVEQLTRDLNQSRQTIGQLEREKDCLIREIFQRQKPPITSLMAPLCTDI